MNATTYRKPYRWIHAATGALTLVVTLSCSACTSSGGPRVSSPQKGTIPTSSTPNPDTHAIPAVLSNGARLVNPYGCAVYQQTGPEGIRWYTPGGSKGCQAWIFDPTPPNFKTYGYKYIESQGPDYSSWQLNRNMEVCVNNQTGQMYCGTDN